MATRRKTLEYWFPHLTTIADNIDTNFTQITVTIPETIVAFRSVVVEVTLIDAAVTLANVANRNMDIQLAAVGYTSVDNAQTWSQSGENFTMHWLQNFTSYFTTNWTGTAMTMDLRVLMNTSASGSRNGSARVIIDYDYDDTSATHAKTVYIPLNAPLTALATTKPGAATATIPNLSTYCPENSPTFLQTAIIVQGNTESASTTDSSISQEIDTAGVFTSQLFERGSNASYSYRLANVVSFTTNATHSYYIWGSITDYDHPQVMLAVTYSFTVSGTTRALNSLRLPMEFSGPMGSSSSLFNRATRDLWIQEPGTITVQTCGLYVFYETSGVITGINARIGTGSFAAYTSVGTTVGGSCMFMIRNDSITLARGKNTLQADIYNTDTNDPGAGLSSFWIINYHSDIMSAGIGAHNHTVIRNIIPTGTAALVARRTSATIAVNIPEANYFINALGVEYIFMNSGTTNAGGCYVGVERLAAGEGGFNWEHVYESMNSSDPEQSVRWAYGTARSILARWPGDQDGGGERLDLETGRRWTCSQSWLADHVLNLMLTYHAGTYTISGTISNSNGGNVDIFLHRVDEGEHVLSTSRTGDGSYSFTWYDDTAQVYVSAYEDATHHGRSKTGVVATDFDISLHTTGPGGGETAHTFIG